MNCIAPSPETVVFNKETIDIDVVSKYKALMVASKEKDGMILYIKDTIDHVFKDYDISSEEKGKIVAQTIGQVAINTNQSAMQLAVQWASTEQEQAYTLAKLKNDAIASELMIYKIYAESCLVGENAALLKAQADKTVADMIREDGRVATRDADGVITALTAEGFKFSQIEKTVADTYAVMAETYRKNGIVEIGVGVTDGITKGISGDFNGNNYWQMKVTERQEKGFNDNMRQHAANSASQMISFQLSGDAADAIQAEDVQRWRNAVDYLLA